MNISHLQHALYALGFQLIAVIAGLGWVAGAAFAIGWFVSREHAQHEYHLTQGGSVKDLKPWQGLEFWNWSLDGRFDALAAIVTVVLGCFIGPMVL